MPIRTQSELLTLYADNSTGDISAADLRDLVDTFFQPRTVRVQATLQAATSGPGRPTAAEIGPTSYHSFAVADEYWPHVALPDELDEDADVLIHVDWFPLLSEATRTVSWDLDYLSFHDDGVATVDVAQGTLQVVDAAVPATQYVAISSTFTIPAADIDAADHEIRLRLQRVASTNDPADIGVHHIWAEVITKPPGTN